MIHQEIFSNILENVGRQWHFTMSVTFNQSQRYLQLRKRNQKKRKQKNGFFAVQDRSGSDGLRTGYVAG